MLYLDHAASTPMRPVALQAMLPYLAEHPGNPSGSHAAARAAKTALEVAREDVARRLGAQPDEVVFTAGGSEADNLAIKGFARALGPDAPREVVVAAFEHKAVLAAASRLAGEGFDVRTVRVTGDGVVDLDHLADLVGPGTALVSVMLVNNEVGTVQPLSDVAAVLRDRAPGARLHTDAVQGPPWLDVAPLVRDADLVSISAHKLGGPKGCGALVVRQGVNLRPELEGGGQERGLRSGTVDVAGAVALAAALDALHEQRAVETTANARRRDQVRDALLDLPGAFLNGSDAHRVAGFVPVGFEDVEAELLLFLLDERGLCAAAGSSCASGATEPSHVLSAIGRSAEAARASIRLTFGWCSTDADADAAIELVSECVDQLRRSPARASG